MQNLDYEENNSSTVNRNKEWIKSLPLAQSPSSNFRINTFLLKNNAKDDLALNCIEKKKIGGVRRKSLATEKFLSPSTSNAVVAADQIEYDLYTSEIKENKKIRIIYLNGQLVNGKKLIMRCFPKNTISGISNFPTVTNFTVQELLYCVRMDHTYALKILPDTTISSQPPENIQYEKNIKFKSADDSDNSQNFVNNDCVLDGIIKTEVTIDEQPLQDLVTNIKEENDIDDEYTAPVDANENPLNTYIKEEPSIWDYDSSSTESNFVVTRDLSNDQNTHESDLKLCTEFYNCLFKDKINGETANGSTNNVNKSTEKEMPNLATQEEGVAKCNTQNMFLGNSSMSQINSPINQNSTFVKDTIATERNTQFDKQKHLNEINAAEEPVIKKRKVSDLVPFNNPNVLELRTKESNIGSSTLAKQIEIEGLVPATSSHQDTVECKNLKDKEPVKSNYASTSANDNDKMIEKEVFQPVMDGIYFIGFERKIVRFSSCDEIPENLTKKILYAKITSKCLEKTSLNTSCQNIELKETESARLIPHEINDKSTHSNNVIKENTESLLVKNDKSQGKTQVKLKSDSLLNKKTKPKNENEAKTYNLRKLKDNADVSNEHTKSIHRSSKCTCNEPNIRKTSKAKAKNNNKRTFESDNMKTGTTKAKTSTKLTSIKSGNRKTSTTKAENKADDGQMGHRNIKNKKRKEKVRIEPEIPKKQKKVSAERLKYLERFFSVDLKPPVENGKSKTSSSVNECSRKIAKNDTNSSQRKSVRIKNSFVKRESKQLSLNKDVSWSKDATNNKKEKMLPLEPEVSKKTKLNVKKQPTSSILKAGNKQRKIENNKLVKVSQDGGNNIGLSSQKSKMFKQNIEIVHKSVTVLEENCNKKLEIDKNQKIGLEPITKKMRLECNVVAQNENLKLKECVIKNGKNSMTKFDKFANERSKNPSFLAENSDLPITEEQLDCNKKQLRVKRIRKDPCISQYKTKNRTVRETIQLASETVPVNTSISPLAQDKAVEIQNEANILKKWKTTIKKKIQKNSVKK